MWFNVSGVAWFFHALKLWYIHCDCNWCSLWNLRSEILFPDEPSSSYITMVSYCYILFTSHLTNFNYAERYKILQLFSTCKSRHFRSYNRLLVTLSIDSHEMQKCIVKSKCIWCNANLIPNFSSYYIVTIKHRYFYQIFSFVQSASHGQGLGRARAVRLRNNNNNTCLLVNFQNKCEILVCLLPAVLINRHVFMYFSINVAMTLYVNI